ncbi:MAG TPA: TonB family protein [Pyrinomonadaceae bacterium]|nr:TonB family protein [Pyrinomonadaceae bacterium]
MNRFVKTWPGFAFTTLLLICAMASLAWAQQTTADAKGPSLAGSSNLSQAQIDEIIRRFAAKETEFRQALNSYAFKRDALLQEIGMGGQVIGEYHRVSSFTFDDKGNRFEKIGFFPMPSLQGVSVTNEDLEDLGGVNPFALEAAKISQYNFKYVGKERIDELDLYVFEVSPKVMPSPKSKERVFVGRIWVDDRDLQIVKAKGKAGPETKQNKFPIVETYREQIDGKYWFPTYVYADDDLIFDNGTDVRIRMQVKYSDFVVGRGRVTITEISEAPEQLKPETKTPEKTQSDKAPPQTAVSPAKSTTPSKPDAAGEDEESLSDAGILNSLAIDLPKPVYPAAAKKDRISGQVQVKVVLDETGKVVSAEATFGPEQLRAAAVEAAKRARFKPTLSGGVPQKVFGIVLYDFVAP